MQRKRIGGAAAEKDDGQRFLLYHDPSESYAEAFGSKAAAKQLDDNPDLDDVTGDARHEEAFRRSAEPLHVKYRPRRLQDMVGQGDVVRSLEDVLKAKSRPHSYLFTGPSGCGKTTVARILVSEFGCDPGNLIEVDAASNRGIDAMRDITATLRYKGFGDQPNKCIIIDECHALTKEAWDSLLKSVEEPPPHVFFFFCTTVPSKVPATIATRCPTYALKPARYADLMDLLEDVCKRERFDTPDDILELVARSCDGSPRKALVMLAQVAQCKDRDEAADLLAAPDEAKEIIDLCRLLVQGKDLTWPDVVKALEAVGEQPAESIRITVSCYVAACLMKTRSDKETERLLRVLEAFSRPCNPTDKLAPVMIAFGRFVFD